MLAEAGVTVILGERLDLKHGVRKQDTRITQLVMESGRVFAGRIFIDATYEGDLMAKAGVAYAVGREANAQYGETLNGVQTRNAKYASVRESDRSLPHAGRPAERAAAGRACRRSRARGRRRPARSGLQLPHVPDRCAAEPCAVSQAGRLRSAPLRITAAISSGRRGARRGRPVAHAEPQVGQQ